MYFYDITKYLLVLKKVFIEKNTHYYKMLTYNH